MAQVTHILPWKMVEKSIQIYMDGNGDGNYLKALRFLFEPFLGKGNFTAEVWKELMAEVTDEASFNAFLKKKAVA
jgi:hypothetical protein